MDAGATTGEWRRLLFQGLFQAPGMVGEVRDTRCMLAFADASERLTHRITSQRQAVKGSHLIAAVMAAEGFDTAPAAGASRHDVITSVVLRSPARQARAHLRSRLRLAQPRA